MMLLFWVSERVSVSHSQAEEACLYLARSNGKLGQNHSKRYWLITFMGELYRWGHVETDGIRWQVTNPTWVRLEHPSADGAPRFLLVGARDPGQTSAFRNKWGDDFKVQESPEHCAAWIKTGVCQGFPHNPTCHWIKRLPSITAGLDKLPDQNLPRSSNHWEILEVRNRFRPTWIPLEKEIPRSSGLFREGFQQFLGLETIGKPFQWRYLRHDEHRNLGACYFLQREGRIRVRFASASSTCFISRHEPLKIPILLDRLLRFSSGQPPRFSKFGENEHYYEFESVTRSTAQEVARILEVELEEQ
ncbi:hypothetical protein SCOR_28920 [Sulfidibacter corallicola]